MGLDMYLYAERYTSGYRHNTEQDKKAFVETLAACGLEVGDACHHCPSLTVKVTVGYWRRANQIHKWFVDNVQNGEDECREHSVSREQLEELRDLCQRVIDAAETITGEGRTITNVEMMKKLLPSQAGFFFGGTDYDEFYLQDLESTVKQLDAILGNPRLEEWGFSYCSSW